MCAMPSMLSDALRIPPRAWQTSPCMACMRACLSECRECIFPSKAEYPVCCACPGFVSTILTIVCLLDPAWPCSQCTIYCPLICGAGCLYGLDQRKLMTCRCRDGCREWLSGSSEHVVCCIHDDGEEAMLTNGTVLG
eukprot:m.266979 g.266979  ORF g.266979 m.266979 type:complete len:137 (+) comp32494_c0_seq1:379-789(+)